MALSKITIIEGIPSFTKITYFNSHGLIVVNLSIISFFLQYLGFTCGLVRGCLANLGVTCVVTAEVTQLPACKFQIQVQRG